MGASPEQLEREITQTREQLGATIGQIEQRLSPKRVIRERPWLVVAVLGVAGGTVGWLLSRGGGAED